MRIVTMLLHDERFSGWSLEEKLSRFHFSKQYLNFCRSFGWEPYLYCFHESVSEKKIYEFKDLGVIKVFPVKFRFPPFLKFGNDHNPRAILKELISDDPDLIHFHHYYLLSFPFMVQLIKRKLRCPLTAQLHGYHKKWRRLLYMPCLLQLRKLKRIFYSYKPEETVYRKFGLIDRAVRVPVPSVNPSVFKPGRKKSEGSLLYVGRIPARRSPCTDKSPIHLLFVLHRLLQLKEVNLTIVGDGVGLSYCRSLASKLKIEKNVKFEGFLSRLDLPKFYQRSMLTVVPLELDDIDGFFDGAIQESLACGTAVAAFRSSPKTALEGTLGFLLSKNIEKAAEDASMLLDNPEKLNDIALKGSHFVHSHCTEEELKKRLRLEWEGLLRR